MKSRFVNHPGIPGRTNFIAEETLVAGRLDMLSLNVIDHALFARTGIRADFAAVGAGAARRHLDQLVERPI